MRLSIYNKVAAVCLSSVLLAACGSSKSSVQDKTFVPTSVSGGTHSGTAKTNENRAARSKADLAEERRVQELTFMRKVYDNRVYAKNITGSVTLSVRFGDKDITVPGKLSMRRGEVIRIQAQVPLIGSEVGRIELTPDYVLVVDRMHKRYLKEDYNQLDFLRDNGLNFYSLEALFWNQLLMPGKNTVTDDDLRSYKADLGSNDIVPVTLSNGNMNYSWKMNSASGQITETNVRYGSAHGTSTLEWLYEDFAAVGVKQFPQTQQITINTHAAGKAGDAMLRIEMDNISTNSGWQSTSDVSSKYIRVDAKEILKMLK